MTPHPLSRPLPARLRTVCAAVLAVVTAYLVLDRSHAEEVGGGARVLAEVVRGERPLSTPTWLALGVLAAVLAAGRRRHPQVPVRATRAR